MSYQNKKPSLTRIYLNQAAIVLNGAARISAQITISIAHAYFWYQLGVVGAFDAIFVNPDEKPAIVVPVAKDDEQKVKAVDNP